jgi:hypothetical protein
MHEPGGSRGPTAHGRAWRSPSPRPSSAPLYQLPPTEPLSVLCSRILQVLSSLEAVAMRFRACIALLLFVSACATSAPSPGEPAARDPRLAHLQRAATLPWTDEGRCVVQAASLPWPVLVERCFHALDQDRMEFHDPTGRCAVASAGAADKPRRNKGPSRSPRGRTSLPWGPPRPRSESAAASASPSPCRTEAEMTITTSALTRFRTTASLAGMCS